MLCQTDPGTFDWEWDYRYSAGAERELKRLTVSPQGDTVEFINGAMDEVNPNGAKSHNWSYYLLGADKRQLAVYAGRQASRVYTDGFSNFAAERTVTLRPTEYLTYGAGSTPAITTRPDGTKEYKVTDHLGSTRVVLNMAGTALNRS